MTPYLPLAAAIVLETIATTALKSTEGFTRIIPTVIAIAGYVVSFYFLSIALKSIPMSVAYAMWAAGGVALIALVGWVVHKEALDMAAIVGIGFIVLGVVIINMFSKSTGH